ncbi:undecaprenyl/decaprenyl-phosphate alpha-N-acetylglucosaminyl 1-phosphate transferase [Candidatus Uhrbacteria bacterium]|nr:undecaprenyl/decaprenyl-phosphate alpha-N-acetylglucosaminyl 1-phosphate transferase [Candidatus Uhrbacteria bacterium]
MMLLIAWGLLAFVLSFLLTVFVRRLALASGAVDRPSSVRKIHTRPVARLGGLAIFLSLAAVVIGILATSDALTSGEITRLHYIGVLLGGSVLMIGGALDDRYNLPPHTTIIAPILAALVAIGFGIEVDKLTNPLGGVLLLAPWQSDVLVFAWLMIVMYTTKFLDGLDGLATSVTGVGTFMILLLALTTVYFQPDVALLSSVSVGALLGFLFWNVHPASIFLGEGGSTLVGFLLGILAVISGGKVATALLVLGIPLLDVVWVVARRMREGGLARVFVGDKKHLHHRLLALGWGQTRIVILYVAVALAFGLTALFLQSRQKLVALIVLSLVMVLTALFFVQKERHANART